MFPAIADVGSAVPADVEDGFAGPVVQGFTLCPGKLTPVNTFRIGRIGAIDSTAMPLAVAAIGATMVSTGRQPVVCGPSGFRCAYKAHEDAGSSTVGAGTKAPKFGRVSGAPPLWWFWRRSTNSTLPGMRLACCFDSLRAAETSWWLAKTFGRTITQPIDSAGNGWNTASPRLSCPV